MDSRGINNARWHGRLDRKNLGLKLEYIDSGSTLTWTEQCKPTSPVKNNVSADSSPKSDTAPAKKSG
jgi:hypothetical protein